MKIFGNQSYPTTRMRRNRSSEAVRRLFSSNFINPQNLIYPIFICEGSAVKEPISKLPDVFRYSIDETILQIKHNYTYILVIILFIFFSPSFSFKSSFFKYISNPLSKSLIVKYFFKEVSKQKTLLL